jgi:anaerobic magnesium-protoporphyrin IX monomethyl ester cyclase
MKVLLTTLHAKYIHNSLALPYLASYCADVCDEIIIREFTVHEPKENILSAILAERPDVVAFSVYLWNRRESFELIDLVAAVTPGIRLVVGGPEVSFEGVELFEEHPGLTALVRNEGEMPLRGMLEAWQNGHEPVNVPRLTWRKKDGTIVAGEEAPPLDSLDEIPSPFRNGLVDTSRGFVYYETSRGCPYNCSFCMSALDDTVRSFSMPRIESDLQWIIDQGVAKVKLVDRTFNYDARRARQIFSYILEHNQNSHFHFEIGAHLIDEETLALLATVPEGMFHFEIGIQSTLPETLTAINRKVSINKVLDNVEQLKKRCRIELHLDLIAGLPGEDYQHFLQSIDTILTLDPDHLQVEPVKLLPGSPLRRSAKTQNLRHDPNPPYTIVTSDTLSYNEIEQLKTISRLLDLTWNSKRLKGFLGALATLNNGMAAGLERLALHLQKKGLFRLPLSQDGLFDAFWDFICLQFDGQQKELLKQHLARDYARCERVLPQKAPPFFNADLTAAEQSRARKHVEQRQMELRGTNTKLQYFAALFSELSETSARQVHLFLYLTRSGTGREIEEVIFSDNPDF